MVFGQYFLVRVALIADGGSAQQQLAVSTRQGADQVACGQCDFFLKLDPDHPWWKRFYFSVSVRFNPLLAWNRYQWFRLIVPTVLGFTSIPAFIIPLIIAAETVNFTCAGVGYAFLMSLSNTTDMLEGVIGAALYKVFSLPGLDWIVGGFARTFMNIAGTHNDRALILQMFVYIGLFFTLLTLPFIELLRRELDRRGVEIHLGRRPQA